MKKSLFLIITLFLISMLSACSRGGNIDNVERHIGSSRIYAEEEIAEAMDIVEDFFEKEFEGCTLTELTYEEERSNQSCEEWATHYEAEQAIVLISTFKVDASGGDGSFNPNTTYPQWQWILTRNSNERWTLQSWGY